MRKKDKLKNYEQANLMLEQSYLKSKGLLNENTKYTDLKPLEDILLKNGYKWSSDDQGYHGRVDYTKQLDELNKANIALFHGYSEEIPVRILYFVPVDYTFSNGKKMNRGQADIDYKSIDEAKKDLEGVSSIKDM